MTTILYLTRLATRGTGIVTRHLHHVVGRERLLIGSLVPPVSEIGVPFLALPQVGKLVVAYHWSAVYKTEP